MRLVKAPEIQEMDRLTIQKLGIPGAVLMENAARGATRVFLDHFAPSINSSVVVLCGRGNNGGDGYVMARYLQQAGFRVTVILLSKLNNVSGDALINLKVIKKMGLEILEVPDAKRWATKRRVLRNCDYIIDGILGTGLNSPVKGFYGQVLKYVNTLDKPVMAIDIPSGLNADTGQIMGAAIKAELTATFGYPKVGHLIFPGADLVGRLVRIDIGIPDTVATQIPTSSVMTDPSHLNHLFGVENQDIHKGNRGHLLVLSGSTGKTGAAALTSLGGLRAGAGLVTLGVPESLNPILEGKLTEAMTEPLPETSDGSLSLKAEKKIRSLMEGKTALALGPGLSTDPETASLVRRIVAGSRLPTVIDADGLNALSQDRSSISSCGQSTILTPHPGEIARLTGIKASAIQHDRIGTSIQFVKKYGCHLVLKGARTLITQPDGKLYVNPTGNPALSSGGAGDVLTGLIGGFLARGWSMTEAAIAGVYLHGLAADYLAEDMGQVGVLAGELLDVLPELMFSLSRGEWPLEGPPPYADLYYPL
ncbi:MAG: NAD(P)H-hydrate dehydratase [Desulfobacteraceae bacterium]|jgi:NAD(P)H-hydrate epimerase